MKIGFEFPVKNEKYGLVITAKDTSGLQILSLSLNYPVSISHLHGITERVRYHEIRQTESASVGCAEVRLQNGNAYEIEDAWSCEKNIVHLDRSFRCITSAAPAAVRLTSEFQFSDGMAKSFDDYKIIVPGAVYNKNDTNGDGADDYLGTFNQDYRDDRNPSLSVTCFSALKKTFVSLIRADIPHIDKTLTREQINARHFVHQTDIGSLGFSPSMIRSGDVVLRCDYPFYERSSHCLNVDGTGWAAYKDIANGTRYSVSYLLLIDKAESLTAASWQTTELQMNRILDDSVALPFTLEEARQYRRELIFTSFREHMEKRGSPAGYFMHFSPRQSFGKQNILEYGFSGAQTLNCLVMLRAARDLNSAAYRDTALKTIHFFINHCIAESGLPNGIYDVDKEKFVYWWTGILFPFQYSANREELEVYLGEQIVGSLIGVANDLLKIEGNYCRTMSEAMHYLILSYLFEKEAGNEHRDWLDAVVKFCDKMVAIQNDNGSWNRAYTMDGKPVTNPTIWFGGNDLERNSGVIFPSEVLVTLYTCTGNRKYLDASYRAAKYILEHYVDEVKYLGGLNDTTHIKSVKIDAVSVMFAMRTLIMVYEHIMDPQLLVGAREAARILASWTYLWDIPFDQETLLGKYGFKTTGWAGCDTIPACSYVDNEFQEFVPELLQVAAYCKDEKLALLAKIVTRGMQHGLSMPQNMYGYAMPGVQCEGYMTSLWLSDTEYKEFSGAAAKNKGDDNDTCNGLINAQALVNMDYLIDHYGTMNFDQIIDQIKSHEGERFSVLA
jgi:hypothetical protein